MAAHRATHASARARTHLGLVSPGLGPSRRTAALELSEHGARLLTDRSLEEGGTLQVTLRLDFAHLVALRARVIWSRPILSDRGPQAQVGVRFESCGRADRRALERSCRMHGEGERSYSAWGPNATPS